MLVRMALEFHGGFEVVGEAGDGAEALSLANSLKPDAVVLDLAMPVMDGLEAIPAIKRHNPAAKILVLSGFDASQMREEAVAAGADAYLEKGEPAHRIVQVLLELCSGSAHNEARASHSTDPGPRVETEVGTERSADTLSSLAHELMTPVTVVQGFADTLAERADALDAATIKEWARTISRNASNMASIIRSFRETERLETGDTELEIESVDLRRVVEETIIDLGALTRGREVSVTGPSELKVEADQVKVRQILTNLVSNAEKFSPAGTPIEITIGEGSFYAEVCVRDRGRGIAPDQRDALFKKFSRLDAPEPGSGLGLFICRRLARAHGGDVVCKDPKGDGAMFCVRLPLPIS